jgi:hypothetical protein
MFVEILFAAFTLGIKIPEDYKFLIACLAVLVCPGPYLFIPY